MEEIPSACEELKGLQVPDDQIRRQAVNSLRGYIYQVYQTLNAWLRLREDEILVLEVAEDFAVLARGVLTGTQVKDTAASGSVTLRTKSVADTINSLWSFQNRNPDRIVRINYLTTSEIGTEKELTFPEGRSGLTYWPVAARESTDVEPLRQALLSLDLLPQIVDFIKTASPEAFRQRILGRITWICGERDLKGLSQGIRDRLVYLGEPQGFTPNDSERAEDSLIVEILKTVVRKDNRTLSRAELLRILEKSATVSMPLSVIRQFATGALLGLQHESADLTSGSGIAINIAQAPFSGRVIERTELVSTLVSEMGRLGGLWLHGSSGLGKTTLARLIAHRSKRGWLFVQLNGSSAADLDFRLSRTLQAFQSGEIGGVILDDFPTKYAHSVRLRLSMLASEVHRMNGSLVVTAAKPPSPNVRDCFGENEPLVFDVPYLTRDEVAELVTLAGGDAGKWAGIIHAFCGPGHPQLVQARISGLRQRNWPSAELLSDLTGSAEEVDSERQSIRERLLSDLSVDTRELLYRLTLVAGYFDRGLAGALGDLKPAIERPGEAMDILCGPWVETMASDRFRVSPVVGNAGMAVLSKATQIEVHKQIVDDLIRRHPFPADFLGMLLGHALLSRHTKGLIWLTMAVLRAPREHYKAISEHLLILSLLDTHEPLFQDDIRISAMLRLAQFRVTVWMNRTDQLPEIAEQLIGEARMADDQQFAYGFLYLAITSVLLELSLRISPRKWVPLTEELEGLLSGKGELIEHLRELDVIRNGLGGWTIPQFLFALRASSLRSIGEVMELFTELDRLQEKRRSFLLSSLDAVHHGRQLMIDAAWLAEMREGTLDGAMAADMYRQLAAMAEKWSETDIAVGCECARAVMLNEYANDSEAALASLEEAEEKHPASVRILRERAKVYFYRGDHATSLATIDRVVGAIPKTDHIERAFALREAAISAAKTGHLQKAGDYFAEACAAASAAAGPGMARMAVGLKADCALAKFQSGDAADAVRWMRQAITDAEQLDPKADEKVAFCSLVLPQAMLWMQSQVKKVGSRECDFPTVVGSCSTPDPPDKILDMPSPPFLASWYQLAILEPMLRADYGILSELRKRTKTNTIISCELILNYYLMAKYIITLDVESFFSHLPEYVAKTAYMRANAFNVGKENVYGVTENKLSPIGPVDWRSELHLQNAKDAILALAAAAVCGEVADIKGQLLSQIARNQEAATALQSFIASFEGETSPKRDPFDVPAYHLGRLMKANVHLSPDEMFLATYHVWEWLPHTSFKTEIEDMVADYLGRQWRTITKEQRFRLNRPMIAIPAIETAIGEPGQGMQRIARLLLAAETGVRYRLGPDLRSKLQSGH